METLDQLEVMINQESNQYPCPAYLQVGGDASHCSALSVVAACAFLVTDPQPIETTAPTRRASNIASLMSSPKGSFNDVRSIESSQLPSQKRTEEPSQKAYVSLQEFSSLVEWRRQMLDWACVVVDSYDLDHEVVTIAFDVLDRYIGSVVQYESQAYEQLLIQREDFQLYAMVCMYIAVKAVVPYRKLSIDCLKEMSQGCYSSKDITSAELEVLGGVQWRVNPPTIMEFCRRFVSLFPKPLNRKEVLSKCRHLATRVIEEHDFVGKKRSLVALAIVLLSVQQRGVTLEQTQHFLKKLKGLVNVHESEFDATFRQLELLL
eukprot:Nitzschia sp. Nitz4//scaffold81_size91200//80834//81790//NITZ4_005001-RA/size91200-processed-gene-0.94-mRNA-1//-1//CDS//3329558755//2619//frame0